jgi:acetyl esterase
MALAASLARELGLRFVDAPTQSPAAERRRFDVAAVTDSSLPGAKWDVPVRIYRPTLADGAPILVYLHGGGWFSGNLEAVDGNCRELCARAGCVVVSVKYSLSHAHKFPRALQEVDLVCRWLTEHGASVGGDGTRMAIGGESAGANIAAAECLLARSQQGPRFVLQLLIYPVLNADLSRPEIIASRDPILSPGLLRAMWYRYVSSDEDYRNPLFSPSRTDSHAGLPAAMIVTAGTDPLRTEGEAFATALAAAGVSTRHHNCDELFHGFFGLPHPRAEDAMVEVVAALREAFDG